MKDWITEHLEELRKRIIKICCLFLITSALSYYFADNIFQFLTLPLKIIWKSNSPQLIYTGFTEVFMSYIKIAIFSGFCITFPCLAIQTWLFMIPGLYKNEQRMFKNILIFTPILFIFGASFAYFFVLPTAYKFFLSFETFGQVAIVFQPRVEEYLSFVFHLILAFAICFEFPLVLIFLCKIGILNKKKLMNHWQTAVVVISVVCAFITPPDLLSMVCLIVPLFILYCATILFV